MNDPSLMGADPKPFSGISLTSAEKCGVYISGRSPLFRNQ